MVLPTLKHYWLIFASTLAGVLIVFIAVEKNGGGSVLHSSRVRFGKSILHLIYITTAGICLGSVYNLCAAEGLLAASQSVNDVQKSEAYSFLSKISTSKLKELRSGNAVNIIDARMPSDYQYGHIEGATNLPADISSEDLHQAISELDRNRMTVIYCQSSSCPYSRILSQRLQGEGFANLAIYTQGWVGWIAAKE